MGYSCESYGCYLSFPKISYNVNCDSFGVTSYSLPRDQIGYWAIKIVIGVPEVIPVLGFFVSFFCIWLYASPIMVYHLFEYFPF